MRLNGHVAWLLIPAALNVIHGCIGPYAEGGQDLDFSVLDSRVQPGSCFAGLDPDRFECHLLRVSIQNLDQRNRTHVDSFNYAWEALGTNGTIWEQPFVDDNGAFAPGETRQVWMGFTTTPGTILTELEWSGGQGAVTRPIPA